MSQLTRRRFAAGLAAGLLAAPFLGRLRGLRADGTKTAKRLVVYFSPNGTIHKHWRPSGTGSNFTLPAGSILEPLAAHKSDIIVCDGINFKDVANHEPGMRAMLTGNGDASSASQGKSLDQYVASKIGENDPFPSLEFGVFTSVWGSGQQTRMSYSAPEVVVNPVDNPLAIYERMFGSVNQSPEDADQLEGMRASIGKVISSELTALQGMVGRRERAKLDDHLAAVKRQQRGGAGAVSCGEPPPAPTGVSTSEDDVEAATKAQIDLLTLSLACGMTHVASLQMSHTVSPLHLKWLGITTQDHHSLSHSADEDTIGVENFIKAERWFAEQFGYLLAQLKATPAPEGGTLLDSTLVVWCKELGDGRLHDCDSVPWVLAGGGVFTPGRYLNFGGAPHQKLLVSICQAMGLGNNTFGDASKGQGPLSELA